MLAAIAKNIVHQINIRQNNMRTLIKVIIPILIFTSCGGKKQTDTFNPISKISHDKTVKIDSIFSKYNQNTPGYAVAIVQNGEVVFMKAYGMANPKKEIQISPDTRFLIGSNSKQFTCMSILLLEEQGKLNIDDPIKNYLPELPDYAKLVTIKHLMQHTSGIIEFNPLLFLSGMNKTECNITNDEIFSLISKYPKTSFKTGDHFFYTNSTYILLAKIIELVSKQTYADFVQENIFSPLGMNNSKVITSKNDYSNVAMGFENQGNYRPVDCRMITTGASGIITTLNDMIKWTNNYYDNQLGNKDQNLANRMQTKGVSNNGDSLSYGLGLFIENQCKQKVVWHGGRITGYTSNITFFPEQKTSIIVLSNTTDRIPYEHRFDIAKVLFDCCEMHPSDLFGEDEIRNEFKKKQSEYTDKTVDVTEYIDKYTVDGFNKYFEIVDNNGKLIAKIDNKEFQLKQVFKDTFVSQPMIFEFKRDKNGEVVSILLSGEKFRNLEVKRNN